MVEAQTGSLLENVQKQPGMSSLTGLIYPLEATMAPLEAGIVFGIELGENVTVTLASARLLMLGAVSSPKIVV